MCPRFLFVGTIKSVHKGHHPQSHTWSTHGRNRTLTSERSSQQHQQSLTFASDRRNPIAVHWPSSRIHRREFRFQIRHRETHEVWESDLDVAILLFCHALALP